MSEVEQNTAQPNDEMVEVEPSMRNDDQQQYAASHRVTPCLDLSSGLPKSQEMADVAATEFKQPLLQRAEKKAESSLSMYTLDSQISNPLRHEDATGRPGRKKKFELLDFAAVISSLICLVIGVMIILPAITISWRLGFQKQIIAIGFLIGVMNICAERVVPSCFLAIEARYGKSRLQNFDAILTNKFLSRHISIYWRIAMILFLVLPLVLSVGYKQFLGGTSTAELKPLSGLYGVSFPNIGEWTPIQDPIYLQFSSNAAFHTVSANDTPILNGSNNYPLAYGYNVLLLAEDSAALLDLPTNEYLNTIRSRFSNGETWQLSASVNAYVAARNISVDEKLRSDDAYWEAALNASEHGLTSYYLNQDANTYVGMLPIVGQPYCWMSLFRGGLTTDDMYSKSLDDGNIFNFRKVAELWNLNRKQCRATWEISATEMRLISGVCDGVTEGSISQEPVLGCKSCPWTVDGGPGLPHIFWRFVVERPNSTWLTSTYAVTTATSYWARGVYMISEGGLSRINYTAIDEQIVSTKETLRPAPLLFFCLAVQPVIIIAAFLIISILSLPLSDNFGLISVLAGIKRPTLDLLGGAGFSGQLKRPLKLEISIVHSNDGNRTSVAAVRYELKSEDKEKYPVAKADTQTVYV